MNMQFHLPVTTPCKISNYAKDANGYARVGVVKLGRTIPVLHHRIAYAEAHNMSPADIKNFVIMHKCDNPGCINPDHLVLGTQADNVKDMITKGRRNPKNHGDLFNNSKLTLDKVREIRASTKSTAELASIYRVSKSAIERVINNITWTSI